MFIETLESRIAPAALFFVNDRTVTWTDSDGDLVTLSISNGSLEESNFKHKDDGAGLVVNKLDLTNEEFAGTSLTVTAKRVVAPDNAIGNGVVDIGYVNAAGNSLGAVTVSGDLGRIDAGPAALTPAKFLAIKSLQAVSLGARLDILDGVLAESEVNGKIGSLTVTGELRGAVHVTGGTFGSIDTLSVGALVGGDFADSGRVDVTGNITKLTVRDNVQGGAGQRSGSVEAGGSIGAVSLGGSLLGGKGEDPSTDGTGVIRAGGTMGSVTIRGSISGGTQQESGLLESGGTMGKVSILGGIYGGSAGKDNGGLRAGALTALTVAGDIRGGSAEHSGFVEVDQIGKLSAQGLIGGSGPDSGKIAVAGTTGSLTMRDIIGGGAGSGQLALAGSVAKLTIGSLLGGDASNSGVVTLGAVTTMTVTGDIVGGSIDDQALADIENSGAIIATSIAKLAINGSIRAGEDFNAKFALLNNAAVRVSNNLGSIVVKGALLGTEETRVLITARGQAFPAINSGQDLAIGTASFGAVAHADILAGYNLDSDLAAAAVNPNAQIGAVTVSGSWTAANLVAGAAYQAAFGNGTDVKSAGVDNPNVKSRIASIVINGAIQGTSAAGDHYGFVAQSIGAFSVGGGKNKVLLNADAANDNDPSSLRYNLANTGDVRLFELAI